MNWIKLAGVLLLALSPAALAWPGGTVSTIGGADDGGTPPPPPVVVPPKGACASLGNNEDCVRCCFDKYLDDLRDCKKDCTHKVWLFGVIPVFSTTDKECFDTCIRKADKTETACSAGCPP